jgi:hypothetical protein
MPRFHLPSEDRFHGFFLGIKHNGDTLKLHHIAAHRGLFYHSTARREVPFHYGYAALLVMGLIESPDHVFIEYLGRIRNRKYIFSADSNVVTDFSSQLLQHRRNAPGVFQIFEIILPAGEHIRDMGSLPCELIEQLKGQVQQMQEQARAADVPQANLDLFKKYEVEIKKYVMPGLEVADAALLASGS